MNNDFCNSSLELQLQKRSPYLEDANELIQCAVESGLIAAKLKEYLPNATQCLSHANVKKSHIKSGQQVVFKLGNIYGMIILLSIGLGVATLIAMAEQAIYKASTSNRK